MGNCCIEGDMRPTLVDPRLVFWGNTDGVTIPLLLDDSAGEDRPPDAFSVTLVLRIGC